MGDYRIVEFYDSEYVDIDSLKFSVRRIQSV